LSFPRYLDKTDSAISSIDLDSLFACSVIFPIIVGSKSVMKIIDLNFSGIKFDISLQQASKDFLGFFFFK